MLSDLMTRKKKLQQLQQLDLPVKKNNIFFIYKSNFSSLNVILQYLIFYYSNKRFEDHLIFNSIKGYGTIMSFFAKFC